MANSTEIVKTSSTILETGQVQGKIYTLRGTQVMLDRDLAELYNVEVRAMNQAVKRNISRFPKEFMFQLNETDMEFLKSQIVIPNLRCDLFDPKKGRGGNRFYPYVFTEQGVAMLSAVLRSPVAINVSIAIMKAFVQARQILVMGQLQNAEISELRARIEKLEMLMEVDQESTKNIKEEVSRIYQAINALSAANHTPLPEIGFNAQRYKE